MKIRLVAIAFLLLSVSLARAERDLGGVRVEFDPEDPVFEIGGGPEFTGEKIIASLFMEFRGNRGESVRYLRVSTEVGIEKTFTGETRLRYAHFDLTPVTLADVQTFSIGLVPITLESEYGLGLECSYKVRGLEVSKNFGALGLEPGFFVKLSGKFLGWQTTRFLGEEDRHGAFDVGTIAGNLGYTWDFGQKNTLRWKILEASTSYSARLQEMDLRTQATFYLNQLIEGAITIGYKRVTNPNSSPLMARTQDQLYLKIGVGILRVGN